LKVKCAVGNLKLNPAVSANPIFKAQIPAFNFADLTALAHEVWRPPRFV
jgi:hypothetical protein